MKLVILDKATMGYDTPFDILDKFGEVTSYDTTSPEELDSHIGDADIVILNKVKVNEAAMANAKKMKLICVFATGYDNIDVSAAKKYGIAVCNVPGYSTDSVTLFTVATVLSLVSHLREYNNFVKNGEYSKSAFANKITPVFHEMKGKTWGIIGFGNIGRAVGKVAEAFGARVIVNKRTPVSDYECVDIDTLCRESDIITVHCPLNTETRNLINKEKIALMKSNVIIVNEARGAVLNEEDIKNAVLNGDIAAFGCDVYSQEPFGENHPYFEIKNCDNVLLTPHTAWGAYEARERCINVITDNIESFLKDLTLNRVDL